MKSTNEITGVNICVGCSSYNSGVLFFYIRQGQDKLTWLTSDHVACPYIMYMALETIQNKCPIKHTFISTWLVSRAVTTEDNAMYLVLFIGILEVFTTWEGVCIAHLPIIQIIGSGCLSKASYRCTKQILYMEYYSFYCGSRPFLKSEIKITMMQVQHLNNLSIYSLYSICGAVCFKSQDTCALLSFWTLLCKSCSQKLWKLKFCSGLAVFSIPPPQSYP